MRPIIYHNPSCGTSRNTLAIMLASGENPEVIEYLSSPYTREKLIELVRQMRVTPRDLLRRKGTPYEELQLDNPELSDEQLIDFMVQYPILVNRPIVVTNKGAKLCRPSEAVFSLLENPVESFQKEDGEIVYAHFDKYFSPFECTLDDLPNIDPKLINPIDINALTATQTERHAPRILILYGSVRERSYSRFLALESARLLSFFGCEVKVFNPHDLPLPDTCSESHPKVQALREAAMWAEGMVWVSPERHGAMTGIMKAQIDWLPLSLGGMRPTQGKTLAVMQVCGGSQSFNTVNQLRILGRWMRLCTIPNQSSVAKAFNEFDENGRMHLSPYYLRVVDVCEELVKFTWLMRGRSDYLTQRYSEAVESAEAVSKRVNQSKL